MSSKEGLLARVNFPLYTVQMLTSRHILVAGGGGGARTGVPNGFEVFELSHNGHQFSAEECLRHLTGGRSVMNCATTCTPENTYVAAGQENYCQLYTVDFRVSSTNSFKREEECSDVKGAEIRKRKKRNSNSISKSKEENSPAGRNGLKSDNDKILQLCMESLDSVKTDNGKVDPHQRVVRISRSGHFMATGGTDGYLRLWTFPNMERWQEIRAHWKENDKNKIEIEIDDLDFSPDEKLIVSVGKDGRARVWNVDTGKKVRDLQWNYPNGTNYLCKRCRFGEVEDNKNLNRLFVLTNPNRKVDKNNPAYLQQWDASNGILTKSTGFSETLSALAVRNDGRYVAVGTMDSGSVYVLVAFSLQQILLVKKAHSMFVTGLEFVPVSNNSTALSPVEAAVLSISIDNKICIHSVPSRKTFPLWVFLLLTVIVLLSSFFLCSFLGL